MSAQHHQLTVPLAVFHRSLRMLSAANSLWLDLPAGHRRDASGMEVFAARHPTPLNEEVRLLLASTGFQMTPGLTVPAECRAVLAVGDGPLRGRAVGWVRTSGAWEPLAFLRQPGPGMHKFLLGSVGDDIHALSGGKDESRRESHSRTIGALGWDNYRRATNLTVGVVGVGRTGSHLAIRLAQFGVRRLVLVDMDLVELSNTGESLYDREAVGRFKVDVLAHHLSASWPGTNVVPVPASATHIKAIDALQECDLLFSSPDHPVARVSAAAIAACFCIPMIDLGTRVFVDGQVRRQADVRLVLPDERCLLCFGGLERETEGQLLMADPETEEHYYQERDWRGERPGSLSSLNLQATGMALGLFEDLVAGTVRQSTWQHLECRADGQTALTSPVVLSPPGIPCACSIAGWGPAGLPALLPILAARARHLTPL